MAETLPARLGESRPLQSAIFQGDHVPVKGGKYVANALVQPFAGYPVQTLTIEIYDPPGVGQPVLPSLQQAFVNVALVQFRITGKGYHAPLRGQVRPGMASMHIVLNQGCEGSKGNPQPHRAGGKIHVIRVLGAGRIGLGAAKGPEILQLLKGLVAQKILDGVEHRGGVGFDRHPVLGVEHVEIEGTHDGNHGSGGCLMPPHLQPVHIWPDMVGIMDHPVGQPEHLVRQRVQAGKIAVRYGIFRMGGRCHDPASRFP